MAGGPALCFASTPLAPDHWSLQPVQHKFLLWRGTVDPRTNPVVVHVVLNPTDSRWYRCIAALGTGDEPPRQRASLYNRPYTLEERLAIHTACAVVSQAVQERLGLVAQVILAGNNAHSVGPNGELCLGTPDEPSILHAHVLCRGDSNRAYSGTVTLGGAPFGEEAVLKRVKRPWRSDAELDEVRSFLGDAIAREFESFHTHASKRLVK
jgi:hypothetical protein